MITPAPNAPQGSIERVHDFKLTDLSPTDVVLCRNNAPLVKLAFQLIKAGIPCTYLGRDLLKGLEALIDRFKTESIIELRSLLDSYQARETQKLISKNKVKTAQALADRCECLRIIARGCPSVTQVRGTISRLFANGGVTLSTIHKAKGLEWETVWFLNRQLLPSPYATSRSELRQERNLIHVAITRAKLNLKYVTL